MSHKTIKSMTITAKQSGTNIRFSIAGVYVDGMAARKRGAQGAELVAVNGLVDHYCGVGVGADDCELSTVAQYDELEAAADLFDCWHEVASTAEYPGHIPSRC